MRWRLLVDEPTDGVRNMAIDEMLFLSSSRTRAIPTVRLYRFRRPTITLGHNQTARDAVDLEACAARGIECVRRITGGRALLHQHELTWSVTSPATGAFSGLSVRGIYTAINDVFRKVCARIGVPLDSPGVQNITDTSAHPPLSLPCLATPSAHEITSSGRKLVPSAMRRNRLSFLQHGALLFTVDSELWSMVKPPSAPEGLEGIGVWQLVAKPPTAEAVCEAVRSSFEELFAARESADAMTAWELSQLPRLEEKYQQWLPAPRTPMC
ncbi:MAG TPA: biotin/lipoate A/B protein ligase family protein [Vicinamibacteria bacterium]|nr:biotin/lipoate A/B protein ligase family protein [Vicinamibacteria bacterium]